MPMRDQLDAVTTDVVEEHITVWDFEILYGEKVNDQYQASTSDDEF